MAKPNRGRSQGQAYIGSFWHIHVYYTYKYMGNALPVHCSDRFINFAGFVVKEASKSLSVKLELIVFLIFFKKSSSFDKP